MVADLLPAQHHSNCPCTADRGARPVIGIIEIPLAISLRKEIDNKWFLVLNGLLSIIFAIILFTMTGVGALALVLTIGIVAIMIGVFLLVAAFRVRNWHQA